MESQPNLTLEQYQYLATSEANITGNEYQQLACFTESPPNYEMWCRFMRVRNHLTCTLDILRGHLSFIDAAKKFVFYGKENEEHGIKVEEIGHLGPQFPTFAPADAKFLRIFHAMIGIMSECEEFIDPLLAGMESSLAIDHLNGIEEFGDVAWYMAVGSDALDTKLQQVFKANISKLCKRYKEKNFSSEAAINRDTKAEAEAMLEATERGQGYA